MNEKEKQELFARILKRDRLAKVRRLAENGNAVYCRVLGEIYFYGIETNDNYLSNLEHAMILMGDSEIYKVEEYVRKNIRPKFGKYGIICKCTEKPKYEEALKWYKMAFEFGEKEAEEKISQIQEILLHGKESESEEHQNQIMQVFKINEVKG